MREGSADENSAGHSSPPGQTAEEITTKREPREVRDERPSTNEQHVPRRISRKTTPQEHPVAVTTQEALDGYREKSKRVVSVENNALNRV